MRAHRFRPNFDSLTPRITPSSYTTGGNAMATTMMVRAVSEPESMPEEQPTIDDWDLGNPNDPINLDEPTIDPTQWDSGR